MDKPWENEPDQEFGTVLGFTYGIRRNYGGALCGYVGLPDGHELIGKGYENEAVGALTVHGGITYAEEISPLNLMELSDPLDRMAVQAPDWWLGFDCAHSGDLSPEFIKHGMDHGQYRTIEYVRDEILYLVQQLQTKQLEGS